MKKNNPYGKLFPIPLDVKAGETYYWCGCGQTTSEPLCDQKDCGDKCIAYRALITETILFCGCKQSAEPPICDGTHSQLLIEKLRKEKD